MPQHKIKSISIQAWKLIYFRPPHENQVNSDTCAEIKSIWIRHTEINTILTTPQKPSQFLFVHKNQVIFGPHAKTKSISTTRTKKEPTDANIENMLFLAHTQKTSLFRSSHENQANFPPYTK